MSVAYWSGNKRFLTLTLCGDNWQTRRNRVKQLTYTANAAHGAVSLVWCVEPNPADTGHHIHALTGGAYIDQDDWSTMADAVGMGEVCWISRAQTRGAASYVSKAGLYSAKGCGGGPDEYAAWLALGGGRGVHWSRRAFGGECFATAYKAFCADKGYGGDDPGPWVREALTEPYSAFSGHRIAPEGKDPRGRPATLLDA